MYLHCFHFFRAFFHFFVVFIHLDSLFLLFNVSTKQYRECSGKSEKALYFSAWTIALRLAKMVQFNYYYYSSVFYSILSITVLHWIIIEIFAQFSMSARAQIYASINKHYSCHQFKFQIIQTGNLEKKERIRKSDFPFKSTLQFFRFMVLNVFHLFLFSFVGFSRFTEHLLELWVHTQCVHGKALNVGKKQRIKEC